MNVRYTRQALKALIRMQPAKAKAIQARIHQVAGGNTTGLDIVPMQGRHVIFRLRAGDYRVIYEINEQAMTLIVIRIGARGDVNK